MGGDTFVSAVAGLEVEEAHGDELREAWVEEFDLLVDEVCAVRGRASAVGRGEGPWLPLGPGELKQAPARRRRSST